MGRPKGAKDKKPRKPRTTMGPATVEAPYGYTIKGIPRTRPGKMPKTPEGRAALRKVNAEKGFVTQHKGAQEYAKKLETEKPSQPDKGGRPVKPVDEALLKSLCLIDCTDLEIAGVLGIDTATLDRRYADFIAEHRAHGKASLRRLQLRIAQGQPERKRITRNPEDGTEVEEILEPAMAPNASMAIHLGKHRLGQKDTPNTTNVAVLGGPAVPTLSLMSPETEGQLVARFMSICPDPGLMQEFVALDPSKEVSQGA